MDIKSAGKYMVEVQVIMSHDGKTHYQEMPSVEGYAPPEKEMDVKTFKLIFTGEGRFRTAFFRVDGVDKRRKVHLTPIKQGGVPIDNVSEIIDDLENCIGTFQPISATAIRV